MKDISAEVVERYWSNFNRLHQQLSDKIVAVLPHIPLVPPAKHQNDLSECSSDHVPHCVEATTASTTESPSVVAR